MENAHLVSHSVQTHKREFPHCIMFKDFILVNVCNVCMAPQHLCNKIDAFLWYSYVIIKYYVMVLYIYCVFV